ncbi:MAG: hypothetical protein QXT45_05455 [Candidatus Bilamarchaeaceae archaeon]
MARLVFNGKEFNSLEALQQDPDFLALDDNNQNHLIALFNGQVPPPQTGVPRSVTARQFRSALVLRNIATEQIISVINLLPSPQKELALIAWEYSNEFERDNPLLNQLAPLLNISQQELDEFFIFASTL